MLLVLGGTSWLGGAVAAHAVEQGVEVTCLARGESGTVPAGATLIQADRRQPGAYDGLARFDAAVEVSWQPELVRSALAEVDAGHWVYVSSISVYADRQDPTSFETVPAWQGSGEATIADYGEAKIACEETYAKTLDSSSYVVARAGLIGGYGDRTDRLGYWPARTAAAIGDRREMLVPEPTSTPVQVIDVLDLAAWLVHCATEKVSGVYDAVGPVTTLRDVLATSAVAAGTSPTYVGAVSEQLESAGVRPWMGPESLPLWAPGMGGLMQRSTAEAEAAGLRLRPYEETVADALRWERELGIERARTSGLSAEREKAVLSSL